MSKPDAQDRPKRRWLQFRLRTMMIFVAFVWLPLVWLIKVERDGARHSKELLESSVDLFISDTNEPNKEAEEEFQDRNRFWREHEFSIWLHSSVWPSTFPFGESPPASDAKWQE